MSLPRIRALVDRLVGGLIVLCVSVAAIPVLVLLLFVAAASGAAAGVVGGATGGSSRPAAARAPGTLFMPGPCPIPVRFRAAFRKASSGLIV